MYITEICTTYSIHWYSEDSVEINFISSFELNSLNFATMTHSMACVLLGLCREYGAVQTGVSVNPAFLMTHDWLAVDDVAVRSRSFVDKQPCAWRRRRHRRQTEVAGQSSRVFNKWSSSANFQPATSQRRAQNLLLSEEKRLRESTQKIVVWLNLCWTGAALEFHKGCTPTSGNWKATRKS